jgi:DNA-binding beta-propeller fold protein YncE
LLTSNVGAADHWVDLLNLKRAIALPALAAFLLGGTAPAAAYHLAREIKLPGAEGWDYLTFDAARSRLYITHGTHVEVLDTATFAPAGAIADTAGVHGVAIADALGHGYVSAGAASSIVVFDLLSLARLAEIKSTGDNPDAILYEPTTQRVFAFNGRGRNVTAVDTAKNAVVGTIALDAKPEFAVHDAAGRIFVNLEDRNSLAAIDARTLTVAARWPLRGCEEPTGLAIDRQHHRLFAACSNKVMAIIDSTTGDGIAQVPIGAGVDGAAFDAARQLAFASGGDATLTVVHEESPDKFSVVETVVTKPGARTLTLDERTHRIFLVTAQRNPAPPATPQEPHPRPTVVPGTFEVLVVEP